MTNKVQSSKNTFSLTGAVLALVISAVFAGSASAQEMSGFFRFVTKSGGEVYAARWEGRKELDSMKNVELVQQLGYIYTEKAEGTVPLYSIRKLNLNGESPQYMITTSWVSYKSLISPKNKLGWKPYPQDDGIIGYVAEKDSGDSNMLGAYGFRQPTNEKYLRYRIEGKELNQWKNMPNTKFESKPAFHIWKEKPMPIITGTVKDPVIKFPLLGTVDIGFRKAMYNNGNSGYPVNTQAPYGTPDKPLVLSRKDAVSCTFAGCKFNFGFLLTRSTDTEHLNTYAMLTGASPGTLGNSAVFKKGSKVASLIISGTIKDGDNMLTVTLKPNDPKKEYNDENNSFTVKVVLKP